jgi:hypothetical protein
MGFASRSASKHVSVERWIGTNVPVHLMAGLNHGTIIQEPTDKQCSVTKGALLVSNANQFRDWLATATQTGE